MSETKHAPLPWTIEVLAHIVRVVCRVEADDVPCASGLGDDVAICGDVLNQEARANAAFIVRAVNSHQALVEALKAARVWAALQQATQEQP